MILKNIEIMSPDCINIIVDHGVPHNIRHTFKDVESANQFILANGLQDQMKEQYGQSKIYPQPA